MPYSDDSEKVPLNFQWQEGSHEHVLRGDEDARHVARYIIENPVRAGLVTTPFQYPYLGSDVWTLGELIESGI